MSHAHRVIGTKREQYKTITNVVSMSHIHRVIGTNEWLLRIAAAFLLAVVHLDLPIQKNLALLHLQPIQDLHECHTYMFHALTSGYDVQQPFQ